MTYSNDGLGVAQTAQPDPEPGEVGEGDLDTPQADQADGDAAAELEG